MEYFTVLFDVTKSDILHGTAGIMAPAELQGDIDCSNSPAVKVSSSFLQNSYY